MNRSATSKILLLPALLFFVVILSGCSGSSGQYFGRTELPKDNVLHYVSGAEPETLDPQIPDGQPESRIFLALYEGLVEYGPKDMRPIPAIAKSWEINPTLDEYVFHLRDNAKWSDGTPITANDFVYGIRRGLAPDTLSRTAGLAYMIKYAQAYNANQVFVKKDGVFLLAKDFGSVEKAPPPTLGPETDFHKFLSSPERLTLDSSEKRRAKQLDADPKLKAAVDGAEFVPIQGSDVGVEALDDYTLRITLRQSASFFLGVLAHQFFRAVPQKVIEKFGKDWTRPENIVTSGAFRLKLYRPYNELIVEKNPYNWDAQNVHLDGIEFYPVEEPSTIMNLYKAGTIDAFFNHSVPASWIDVVRKYKDEYLDFPENATVYYDMNVTKPPFNDVRVRRAFDLAIDHDGLARFRKVAKPLYDITPSKIFPEYDAARNKVSEEIRKERGISPADWAKHNRYDPDEARRLLGEAGFTVKKDGNTYSCPDFPSDSISITFNTNENNKATAEYVQAQWKENFGVTIRLQTMEFKTFLPTFKSLQYDGFAIFLWSGDYMDPYTFLSLHYGKNNQGGAGFYDPKFDQMLDDANAELDPQKRFEKLARSEAYLMDQIPALPLMISSTNWMKKPYVKGMYPNPGSLFPWKFVYLERDRAKWDHDVENILDDSDPQVDDQLQQLRSTQQQPLK